MCSKAIAAPAFLDAWRLYYPNSQSSEIECQLCHQKALVGGDGWNAYGWNVRFWYDFFGRTSIEFAFKEAESANSDQDSENFTNLEEIELSLYPGWVNTNTNTIFFKNGSFLTDQPPPFLEGNDVTQTPEKSEEFCFPIISLNSNVILICL